MNIYLWIYYIKQLQKMSLTISWLYLLGIFSGGLFKGSLKLFQSWAHECSWNMANVFSPLIRGSLEKLDLNNSCCKLGSFKLSWILVSEVLYPTFII